MVYTFYKNLISFFLNTFRRNFIRKVISYCDIIKVFVENGKKIVNYLLLLSSF